MLKFLIELFASISSVFISGANKPNVVPPLNTAIISYQETHYAPAVADLGNFPWAKKISSETKPTPPPPPAPAPAPSPLPSLPSLTPTPTPTPTPPVSTPTPPQDPYLATPEPIISWLNMNLTLRGISSEGDRTLPELTFDREYWRIEVFAYWAPDIIPPKPLIENDYFKLEVYEKGTNKLIYTMTSGSNEAFHKLQALRKPGIYYFKVYSKNPSKWEMSFVVSPKIAQ